MKGISSIFWRYVGVRSCASWHLVTSRDVQRRGAAIQLVAGPFAVKNKGQGLTVCQTGCLGLAYIILTEWECSSCTRKLEHDQETKNIEKPRIEKWNTCHKGALCPSKAGLPETQAGLEYPTKLQIYHIAFHRSTYSNELDKLTLDTHHLIRIDSLYFRLLPRVLPIKAS